MILPMVRSADRIGKYVMRVKLGEGGMGEVWKAWDVELKREVALKIIKGRDGEERTRFRREAQAAGRLTHPGIAAVYEATDDYIAMQYVDGADLSDYDCGDHRKVVTLIRDAARAVHHAHDFGIIHRDIKPHNLRIDKTERVFVMDFGLAKQTAVDSSISTTGVLLGTPTYMPPEQARGDLWKVDVRSDVYSLGATLYDLLAGRPPFEGAAVHDVLMKVIHHDPPRLRRIRSDMDRDLETIVMKCLERDPARRYGSAAALAEELTRWLEGEPILARPSSWIYRMKKRLARRRAAVTVGAVGLGISIVIAAVFLLGNYLESRARDEARTHVDKGRGILTRLDRMLSAVGWTDEERRSLAEKARAEFSRALEIFPDHPEALLETARSHVLEGNCDAALEWCTKAIESSPSFATAYMERALLRLEVYERMRHLPGGDTVPETREAEALRMDIREDLRQVRRHSFEVAELRFAEGMMAFAAGEYEEAGRLLEDYAQSVVADPRAWDNAGCAWRHVPGRERDAIEAFSKALEYRPHSPVVLSQRSWMRYELALQLRIRGRADEARDLLRGAADDHTMVLRMRPGDPDALFDRGTFLLELGEYDRAIDDFNQALQRRPNSSELHCIRGDARRGQNDTQGAITDYDKAIELNPRNSRAHYNRGMARHALKRYGDAIEDFTEAVRIRPDYARAFNSRGISRKNLGDNDGAWEDFKKAIQLDPDLPYAYVNRGVLLRGRGDLEEAVAEYTKALQINPNLMTALYNRGNAYRELGDMDSAVKDYRVCLRVNPRALQVSINLSLALRSKARILAKEGKHREEKTALASAVEALTAAIRAQPDKAVAY